MPYSVPEITLEDLPRLIGLLPEEILKMDDSSISLYLEALKDGMTDVNNIRVMIVGHCGVGKTTLTKRLFGEHVDLRQEIERTNGIEVHVQRCKVQLPEGIWLPLTEGDSQENYYNRIASIMIESSKKAKSDKEEEWSQFGETDKSLQKLPPEQLAENSKSDKAIAKKEEPVAIHKHDDSGPTMNQSTSRSDDAPYNHDVSSHEQRIRIQELVHEVVTCSSADFSRKDNTADLSVWDFAGQHVFYGTHQVFLSKRAVYLLVTDLSEHVDNIVDDECFIDSNGETRCKISDFVAFWLNSIHSYCESEKSGEPPVILIGTFADKLDKEKKQELAGNFFTKLREVLVHSAAYDHLECENFTIDNSVKDPNVELLKQKIVEIATKQSYWNELYPSRWVLLEQSLMEFKKRGIQVLNRRILEETNKKLPVPIQSTSELDLFLRYHHETGFILYFSDENLKDYILLEPQWLVDALRSLITARQFCEKKASFFKTWLDFDSTALLKRELIDAVWEVGTPFHEHKDLILDYMEKLGIIARPRHSLQCEDFYIAPCVLKQTVPDRLLEFSVGDCKSTSRLCFSTASKIMPVQVFHKLIADCITRWPISQHKSAYQIFCGCCMFDVDNLHMLYVYFRDSVIQIWITKYSKIEPEPDINVCIAVKEFVEQHLHNTLRGSCELETYVKCPHANIKLPDHWWKVDELSENKEVRCNSHDPRIVLTTSELMKYWDPQHADQMEVYPETFLKSIPNEKQLSQMAQRIGKEYRSLGLVLGLSEVKLDHLDMDEQRHAPADKITAMLNTWVKLKSPNATFGELKHAMSCTGLDWMNIFKGL
ncbi:uncharacterized protein LOC128559434 isoform X2 [Mercenaria mercenaria]|uniref:uncharacterized protein LOC128559434 isoform X2 n=1 Tax=Mercenaria mercenaria TaxID=6596 RepID=UPI00234E9C38|nr:uncharacterized protein LOC128559434 isoform X2 [Mercenaria mercenaria]